MENEINYFKNAKWAMLNGAFTAADLREIAERIENEDLQSEPLGSVARSEEAIRKTMNEAQKRQDSRNKHEE